MSQNVPFSRSSDAEQQDQAARSSESNAFLLKLWDSIEEAGSAQNGENYCDSRGQKLVNPTTAEGRVFCFRNQAPGCIEVVSFPSGPDTLAGNATERCVLKRTVRGGSISLQENYFDAQGVLSARVLTDLDSDGRLRVETSLAGEQRSIEYSNGRFVSLSMEATNADGMKQTVRFILDDQGKPTDLIVTGVAGVAVAIEPGRKQQLLQAAATVLHQVAKQYDLKNGGQAGGRVDGPFLSVADVMSKLKTAGNQFDSSNAAKLFAPGVRRGDGIDPCSTLGAGDAGQRGELDVRDPEPVREKKHIPTDETLSRADVELLVAGLLDKTADEEAKAELFANLQKQFSKLEGKTGNLASRKEMASKIDSAMLGVWDAIASAKDLDPVTANRLASLYLKLAGNPNNVYLPGEGKGGTHLGADLHWTLERVTDEAANGNIACLKILCGLAGGIGSQNRPVTDRVTGQPVPTKALAESCTSALLKFAEENPVLRQKISDELREDFRRGESPDNGFKLFLLGAVCALDDAPLPADVRELLIKKLDDNNAHHNAMRGLLATTAKLDNNEISLIASKIKVSDVPLVVGAFKRLGGDQAVTLILELQSRSVDKWGTVRAEDRIAAIRTLGALSDKYTSSGIIEGLSLLGGPEGAERIRQQLLQAEPLTPESKERIEKDIERIQKEAALALLRITEQTTKQELKSDAFAALATNRWCKDIAELDSVENGIAKSRIDKLLQANPENVTIQHLGPKLLYSTRPLVTGDETKDPASAARLAAAFRDQGAQGNDFEALELAKSAIARNGLKDCQAVGDKLAYFNALPAEEKRKLTEFDYELRGERSFDMSGKSVSAETFKKLSKEVQLELAGSEEDCEKAALSGLSSIEKKTISAGAFNRLAPELRKELSGSEEKIEEPEELFLQGRRMSAEVFNALPEEARIRLTGKPDKLPESQKVVFDEKFSLSPQQLISLPRAVREKLLDGAELDLNKNLSLKGKSLDPDLFNSLNPTERYWLTGNSSTVQGKLFVPDLSMVRLSAEDFNSIRPDVRRAIGLPDCQLKPGQSVSLAGLTITSEQFRYLPDSVKIAITGSTNPLPDGRVVKDLSLLSISAEEFNALSPALRREVSGTISSISATGVFLRLADGTLNERTFAGRVLAIDGTLEKQVNESKSAALAKVEKEKALLKKLIEQEEAVQKSVLTHSTTGLGLLNKFGDHVNRDAFGDGMAAFRQKQSEDIFALSALSKLVADQRKTVAAAEAALKTYEIAVRNREYVQALREGRVQFADRLAMEALTKCGAATFLAPDLTQALFKGGAGVEASTAARMYDAGLSQSKTLYQATSDAPPDYKRGLEILTKITKPAPYSPEGQRLPYGYEDTQWLMQQGLLQIEGDPAYARMISGLEKVSQLSSELQPLIGALRQNGDKFEDFINKSQSLGQQLKKSLSLTEEDKSKLYEMRAELKKLIDSPEKLAPEVLEQLKLRFKALDRGLMVLDEKYDVKKFHPKQFARREELIKLLERSTPTFTTKYADPPKDDPRYKAYGEMGYDKTAATYLYWNSLREDYQKELLELNAQYFPRYALQKSVDFLARPESISESDFTNWVLTDGVEIAATLALVVAATAIIIASGGTAAPLVVVIAGSVAVLSVGGREAVRELQYQAGIRSEGSRFGDLSRGKMVEECGYDRPMEFGRDVALPLAGEFAFEFTLNLICAGLGEGIGSVGGRIIAGIERILPQNARLFTKTAELFAKFECAVAKEAGLKRFMMILAKEAVIQPPCMVASIVAQDELMMTAKRQGWALQETNTLGTFALGVGTSALFSSLCVKGRGAARTFDRAGRQVNLELQVSCTQREFDSYVRSAKARNSVFEAQGNRVIERTAEGLVVSWERLPPGKVQPRQNPGEVTVLKSEASGDGPQPRVLSYNEQRLTQLSDALRAANKAKDTVTANGIKEKMHEILCEEAAAMCKELDLPGLVPTKDLLGLTFSGDHGTFSSETGFIKINMMGSEPFTSLKHELTHLARVCHREALSRADRKAFDRCLLEECIAKIGTNEPRFDNFTAFFEERTPIQNKELMRDAVREYFEKHGAKIPHDLNHLDSIFDNPKYAKLVEELGGKDNCSFELMQELSNVVAARDFVCGVSKKNLAARGLEPTIEKLTARYREAKEKCGGTLDGYAPLKKYTAGASQSREAQSDRSQYRFSPEETAAHRRQYAQQLAVMRAEMQKRGATPEQFKAEAEPQLLALKINQRAEQVQKALRLFDAETDPVKKQQHRKTAEDAAKELVQALERNPDTDANAERFLPYLLERQLIRFADLSPALQSRVRGPAAPAEVPPGASGDDSTVMRKSTDESAQKAGKDSTPLLPVPLLPAGEPAAFNAVSDFAPEVTVGSKTWKAGPEAVSLKKNLAEFNKAFEAGDYATANKIAQNPARFNSPDTKPIVVDTVEVPFDLSAYQKAVTTKSDKTTSILQKHLSAMRESAKTVEVETASGVTVTSKLPRSVVTFEGIKVDLLTGKAIVPAGTKPTAAHAKAEAAVKGFKETPAGKEACTRIAAEQALTSMKERIQAQQQSSSGKGVSSAYAHFVHDMMADSDAHTHSLFDRHTALTAEQEVFVSLYESGWSAAKLEHHFGKHSAETLQPVLEFVRAKEALKALPDAEQAALVEMLVQEASAPVRRGLTKNLPDLIAESNANPQNTVSRTEVIRDSLQRISEAADADFKTLETTLKTMVQDNPSLKESKVFSRVMDEVLAMKMMRDGRLLEQSNADALIRMGKSLEALGLPQNGKLQAAVDKRINDFLNSNPKLTEPHRIALDALAKSLNISERTLNRIRDYKPKDGSEGTEVVGMDILEAFMKDHVKSKIPMNEFIEKLQKGTFKDRHDVKDVWNHADALGDKLWVFDIGGNNYRVLAEFDYQKKQLKIIRAGTHADYDRWKLK